MAEHDSMSRDDLPVLRDAIAASLGGAYWTVDGGGWSDPRPSFSEGIADLLAPSVVVGAAPLGPDVDLPEMLSAPAVGSAEPVDLMVAEASAPLGSAASPGPGRHRRMARVG